MYMFAVVRGHFCSTVFSLFRSCCVHRATTASCLPAARRRITRIHLTLHHPSSRAPRFLPWYHWTYSLLICNLSRRSHPLRTRCCGERVVTHSEAVAAGSRNWCEQWCTFTSPSTSYYLLSHHHASLCTSLSTSVTYETVGACDRCCPRGEGAVSAIQLLIWCKARERRARLLSCVHECVPGREKRGKE